MSNLLLTKEELIELCGVTRPSLQIKWLTANAWRFSVAANGHPRVARDHFAQRLVFAVLPEKHKSSEPRFDRLNNMNDPKRQLALIR